MTPDTLDTPEPAPKRQSFLWGRKSLTALRAFAATRIEEKRSWQELATKLGAPVQSVRDKACQLGYVKKRARVRHVWTPKEKALLRELCKKKKKQKPRITWKVVAAELQMEPRDVMQKAWRMGLAKKREPDFSPAEDAYLVKEWQTLTMRTMLDGLKKITGRRKRRKPSAVRARARALGLYDSGGRGGERGQGVVTMLDACDKILVLSRAQGMTVLRFYDVKIVKNPGYGLGGMSFHVDEAEARLAAEDWWRGRETCRDAARRHNLSRDIVRRRMNAAGLAHTLQAPPDENAAPVRMRHPKATFDALLALPEEPYKTLTWARKHHKMAQTALAAEPQILTLAKSRGYVSGADFPITEREWEAAVGRIRARRAAERERDRERRGPALAALAGIARPEAIAILRASGCELVPVATGVAWNITPKAFLALAEQKRAGALPIAK